MEKGFNLLPFNDLSFSNSSLSVVMSIVSVRSNEVAAASVASASSEEYVRLVNSAIMSISQC